MKPPLPSTLLRMTMAVLCFAFLGSQALQADPYQPAKPKVGTRIVNLFKDLVYWERPASRYEGYGPQSAPQRTASAQRPSRYSLDQPPAELRTGRAPTENYRPSAPSVAAAKPKKPAPEPVQKEIASKPPKEEPQPKKRDTVPEQDRTPVEKQSVPLREKEAPAPTQVASNTITPPAPTVSEPPKQSFMGPASSSTSPSSTSSTTSVAPASSSPEVGSKTGTPGRVKSPYAPFNELDVTGLPTGSLAMDPTTQKVFRVP